MFNFLYPSAKIRIPFQSFFRYILYQYPRQITLTNNALYFSAMVVRFITRRYIGEYDPTLEKIYAYQTVIDNEMVYLEILDTAGQPHVSVGVMRCLVVSAKSCYRIQVKTELWLVICRFYFSFSYFWENQRHERDRLRVLSHRCRYRQHTLLWGQQKVKVKALITITFLAEVEKSTEIISTTM